MCITSYSIRIVLLSRYVNNYGTMAPMSVWSSGPPYCGHRLPCSQRKPNTLPFPCPCRMCFPSCFWSRKWGSGVMRSPALSHMYFAKFFRKRFRSSGAGSSAKAPPSHQAHQCVLSSLPGARAINVCYHHFREHVRSRLVKIYPVSTHDQVADTLTKALSQNAFQQHRRAMCGQ